MTLGATYGEILAEDLLPVPPSLETCTKRGFPHFHSDDGGGLLTATRPNPSKIGASYSFLHRTINTGDLEYIQKLGMQQWYDFLNKYFHWKFKGNHLQEKITDLDKNSFQHLFSVKCSLEALDELDLRDSRKCLNIVKRIRGLDYPGASSLLAVIFKKWFGTVDRGVLESLYAIESLPEKQAIGEDP